MSQARPQSTPKKKWPWVAGAAGGVVLIAGAVNAGKSAEQVTVQPAAAVVETSVSTTTAISTVVSTSVVISTVTTTLTPAATTVTVTAPAEAAAQAEAAPQVEAPAVPTPVPPVAAPSTTPALVTTADARVEEPSGGSAFYKNCAAVWAAGKAPIRVGDPGYSTDLDGDRDGVGCEKRPR